MENINKWRDFIYKCMKPVKPAYRYSSAERPRQHNIAYFFHISNNEQVCLCKYFFVVTLDINNRIKTTVLDKPEKVFLEVDLRDKHKNHKKVDQSIKNGVREHIRSIPRIESQNLLKKTNREDIKGEKNVTDILTDI
ncbi:unnamed protein product [Diabrotica balteata]|uniref:Uncharacterized protein n=1 Tax=Diabrotica balteata TaxID=107213 RepID=A0A9N9SWY8_DIABA|nr:unnamed protein product [Diabrotica balteata]